MSNFLNHFNILCSLVALTLQLQLQLQLSAKTSWKSKGEIGFESRVFLPLENNTNDLGQEIDQFNIAQTARLESKYKNDEWSFKARVFGRVDTFDQIRSTVYPEELWLEYRPEKFKLRLGYQMLDWTATEAFHPADIINSRYWDSSFENADKIGELMAKLQFKLGKGIIEGFYAPRYVESVFPSPNSPVFIGDLSVPFAGFLPVDTFGNMRENYWGHQWGARFEQTFGEADISLQYIEHFNRDQPFAVFDQSIQSTFLVFQPMRQFGLTYTQALGVFVLKCEAAHKNFLNPDQGSFQDKFGRLPDRDQFHTAIGLDYLKSWSNGQDTTFLLEAQYIENIGAQQMNPNQAPALAPLFQNDLLIGFRHSWNDTKSRNLTVTAIADMVRFNQWFINGSYNQRVGESWGLTLGLRKIIIPPENASAPIAFEQWDGLTYPYLNIKRFF